MIKLIAATVLAFGLATATQAMPVTPATPAQQTGGLYTQARIHHGVAIRTTTRHVRREVRRCARWSGGACLRYY